MNRLPLVILLLTTSLCSAQNFQISLENVYVDPSQSEVTVDVTLTHLDPGGYAVTGGSFGVAHPASLLTALEVESIYPSAFIGMEIFDNGWAYADIFGGHGLPITIEGNLPWVRVTYAFDAPLGTTIPLEIVDTLEWTAGGVIPIEIYGQNGGNDLLPTTTVNGSITIGIPFVRGDANNDGIIGLPDIIWIQNYLFLGGETASCADAMDTNADGNITLSDILVLAFYSFIGGAPPVSPFPECGIASESLMGCLEYSCP